MTLTQTQRDDLLRLIAKAIVTMWHPCDGRTREQSPERAIWEDLIGLVHYLENEIVR
mgnify:CR=1 FL=1